MAGLKHVPGLLNFVVVVDDDVVLEGFNEEAKVEQALLKPRVANALRPEHFPMKRRVATDRIMIRSAFERIQ